MDSNRKSLHRRATLLVPRSRAPPLSYFAIRADVAFETLTSSRRVDNELYYVLDHLLETAAVFFFLLSSCLARKNELRNYRKVSAADDVLAPQTSYVYPLHRN